MGKTKIATLGEEAQKPVVTEAAKERKHGKKKSLKEERGVRVPGLKGGERVVAVTAEPVVTEITEKSTEATEKKKVRPKKVRGKNYLAARAKIDPTKLYPIPEAIKLAKETSITKFAGSVELHLVVTKPGISAQVKLPHFTGKARKIEVASAQTIKKLEKDVIDFDVLLATPEIMPQLLPYAKILGPRGLMPNPKNGTLVQDPAKALESFKDNAQTLKTEKEAPLIHTVVGKIDQKDEELTENLAAVILALGAKNIKKAVLSASMGPGIKVAVS